METLRTSSYMIPIKLENEEGRYMLIHGYTGAIDVVSEDVLARIKNITSAKDFSEATLQTLLKRGYVTMKSQEEEYAYVARMAKALYRKCELLHTCFAWIVTYNCNFRCPYCFEGREKKDSNKRITFTKEQADIVYMIQEKLQPHKELRNNVITLYGGEPLMAENKDIVTYIVEEGRKRGYTFVAITNGYEVEHFADLLASDGICKLQITVDGPKEFHNQRRIHYKNHDTFDKIIANIQLALDKGIKVVVRMNSDGKNVEHYAELKNYFEQKGFYNYPKFDLYFALLKDNDAVTSPERQDLNFLSPKTFLDKLELQNAIAQCKDYDIYLNIYKALSESRPIALKSISCGAQTNGYTFDPIGNIYPCWEVIGDKKNIEGTYSKDGIVWDEEVMKQWKIDVGKRIPCSHCQYALLCGGGCPYHYMLGKNMHCAIFRKIFHTVANSAYVDYKINV